MFSFDPRKEGDIYSPLAYDTSLPYACRTCQHLRAIGRLKDAVTPNQALAEMNQISDDLVRQYPTEYSNSGVLFTPLHEYVVGDVRPVLTALLGAVGFVLLIACVNVSHLLVSSAAKRRREFALRVSLGAQSARLFRQMLTESLLLSLMGERSDSCWHGRRCSSSGGREWRRSRNCTMSASMRGCFFSPC